MRMFHLARTFRLSRSPVAFPLGIVVAFALAGCGTSASGTGSTSSTATTGGASSSGAAVQTKSVSVQGATKTVLTDSAGKTLYYFTPDTATTVACAGSCAQLWPPVTASGAAPTAGNGVTGKLAVLDGANGKQVTYNGHPLYTYSADKDSGDAYGEGIMGKWHVVTPDLATLSGAGGVSSKY